MATIWSNTTMVDQRDIKDPKYWRARAKRARTEAGQMFDQRIRRELLAIADNYDDLAERAEAMLEAADLTANRRALIVSSYS